MIACEDGCVLAQSAVDLLLRRRKALELPAMRIVPLPDFLDKARLQRLSTADRERICDQAILIIDQFYAHLPFKRVLYAIDPVQRIRLLRARLGQIGDDGEFHGELLRAFADLRDVHTSYRLPPPFAGAIAFLPFFLQPYFDAQGERHFLVTNVLASFDHPNFRPGVEVTQWNGVRTARAVDLLAQHIPGGNPAARFMRGMMRMTVRSLTTTLPPDEEVVFVQYRGEHPSEYEGILKVPWFAGTGLGTNLFQGNGVSMCEPLKDLAIVRKVLWGGRESAQETQTSAKPEKRHSAKSHLPDVFHFQFPTGEPGTPESAVDPSLLTRNGKRFGYVRIKTFEGDDDAIFKEFHRILRIAETESPDGLILDVRGNAGGSISAAERLLQLLTPRKITPAPFQFANTSALQSIIARLQELSRDPLKYPARLAQIEEAAPYFKDWFEDSQEGLYSGSLLTRGRPVTSQDLANDTGQVYYGPVALIVDAASYSATDTFAAGFQDHEIGDIIGADDNTGGGGASRWLHNQELVQRLRGIVELQPTLRVLPAGAGMALALLRSTRVHANAGEAVEDVGVKCTVRYHLTKADLVDRGRDLIVFACRHLSRKSPYRLQVERPASHDPVLRIVVRSANLDRIAYLLDGNPQGSIPIRGKQGLAKQTLRIRRTGPHGRLARELRIEGYALCAVPGRRGKALVLVACARVPLSRR